MGSSRSFSDLTLLFSESYKQRVEDMSKTLDRELRVVSNEKKRLEAAKRAYGATKDKQVSPFNLYMDENWRYSIFHKYILSKDVKVLKQI